MDDLEEGNMVGLDDILLLEDDEGTCTMTDDNLMPNKCITQSCDEVVSPYVGMSFANVDELKLFYKEYTLMCSFGIRIRTFRKDYVNQMCHIKLV